MQCYNEYVLFYVITKLYAIPETLLLILKHLPEISLQL